MPMSRTRSLLAAAAGALALLSAAPVRAQDPPKRDTARVVIPPDATDRDTLPVLRDSVPEDTTKAAPVLPLAPAVERGGAWNGTWRWERADLAYYHSVSILDLLERVPGLVITRGGSFGAPAGISAFALGGGRTRVFLDGWELHPLGTGTFDVQRLALADLEAVTVRRGLSETRIELRTFRLPDARPWTGIEAGDGDYNTRFLRFLFARPVMGERNLVEALFDLVDTDGYLGRQPFTATTYGARWTHLLSPDRGFRVEYRKTTADLETTTRNPASLAESTDRSELLVRGHARIRGPLWAEVMAGRSSRTQAGTDTVSLEGALQQYVGRLRYVLPAGSLEGTARLLRGSDEGFAPGGSELSVRAEVSPRERLTVSGEARRLDAGGVGGLEAEASARLGLARGLAVFGTAATGTRGIRVARDTTLLRLPIAGVGQPGEPTVAVPLRLFRGEESALQGLRAGAEWAGGGIVAGAAFVRDDVDRVAPYGLAFDVGTASAGGGAEDGVEAWASGPLYFPWARFDGWYARRIAETERRFLPQDQGRLAVELHRVFKGGQLEPTLRGEAVYHGSALTFDPARPDETLAAEPYVLFNLFLQVRVLDVRAFLALENLVNRQTAVDVGGRPLAGSRTTFGARWFLRN